MELKLNIAFEQIFSLANQLSVVEKEKLITALQKSLKISRKQQKKEREFDKFKGQIWMSDDFNEPLGDFKEYME